MPRKTPPQPLYPLSHHYHAAREHAEEKLAVLVVAVQTILDMQENHPDMTAKAICSCLKEPFEDAWRALYGEPQ